MLEDEEESKGPHQGQPILASGEPLEDDLLEQKHAVMIMIHGRGATATDILELSQELQQPDFTYLAPQAAGNTWYPYGFMVPLANNEPYLSSALLVIEHILEYTAQAGIPPERTILLGFSQGACLALEFAARNARRYGGIVGLSGGLIGPDDAPRTYRGSLSDTPVFLGCSDVDPHIPKGRVQATADVLQHLGADVTLRLYPSMEHTINQEEIETIQRIMTQFSIS